MKSLVLLHSSGDVAQLQLLAGLAADDVEDTGFRPWLDFPGAVGTGVATVDATATVEEQVSARIREAGAIIYCVGNTGAGTYQARIEAEQVEKTLEARRRSGEPVHFLPVILKSGSADDLPPWARAYAIVNHDRSLNHIQSLWAEIKMRLAAAPAGPGPVSNVPEDDAEGATIRKILSRVSERPQLCVFVGPYALDAHGDLPMGPAAVTRALLKEAGLDFANDLALPPWPSEAAEWLGFRDQMDQARTALRRAVAPLGLNPPPLANSIGYLASRWIKRRGERKKEKDWQGLLLLTTRIDLALESALAKHWGVGFTRILPTLYKGAPPADQPLMIQQWEPDPNWNPDSSPSERDGYPCENVVAEEGGLPTFPLDDAKRVILVKLCGTLEAPGSLVLTGSSFFENWDNLKSLPKGINDAISSSPHLFLGRGIMSPLAQLVRVNVLKGRMREDMPRVWVVPKATPESKTSDPLCDQELRVLEKNEQNFVQVFQASVMYRGQEDTFVRHLAERL